MNWTAIWTSLFGTTSLFGVNMGFWAGMASVLLIVILMNVVFWSISRKIRVRCDNYCPESYPDFPFMEPEKPGRTKRAD